MFRSSTIIRELACSEPS